MTFYIVSFLIILFSELLYFKIADKFKIADRSGSLSSLSNEVTRGGGVIFTIALWLWAFQSDGDCFPWMLVAVTLTAVVSFIDDINSLSPLLRLGIHFVSVALIFFQFMLDGECIAPGCGLWLKLIFVAILLVICVGAINIYNFMDGINGITAGYSFAALVSLALVNYQVCFVDMDLIIVVALAVFVFAIFNFRPKDKAICLAGDVGSVGIALILLFLTSLLIFKTGDFSWVIFFSVYAVDGVLTICHRVLLHENLLSKHRKHAYQLMANELRMGHLTVTIIYMSLQLAISLGFIYLIPGSPIAHWIYYGAILLILCIFYVLFMKKYYHLHSEYLASIK